MSDTRGMSAERPRRRLGWRSRPGRLPPLGPARSRSDLRPPTQNVTGNLSHFQVILPDLRFFFIT